MSSIDGAVLELLERGDRVNALAEDYGRGYVETAWQFV